MQFVVFKLGGEHYAVETNRVQNINDFMVVTKVPNAPNYIKGLINLRGSIKSLVDINLLLNIPPSNKQSNVIIIKLDDEEVGICVDEVEEVIEIEETELQRHTAKGNIEYIKGIINYQNKLLTVIEIDKLINQ